MKKIFTLIAILVLTFNFLAAQSEKEIIKQRFQSESKKVIAHYKNAPKKLKAARFLLKNLPIHRSFVCDWVTKEGKNIELDEFDFESFEHYEEHLKKIKQKGAQPRVHAMRDVKTIDANFLIDNIDAAFEAWTSSPWHSSYSFETFCEYILPYRNAIEPVRKGWRQDYATIYREALVRASDRTDPIQVCSEVIRKMEYFEFQFSRDYPQPLLSIDQVHFRRVGSCPDLANAAVLNCRALGLATTFDFTPANAASSNLHFWNTVVDTQGNHIPFNSNQNLPYEYDPNYRRLGKVLRHTFSKQNGALPNFVSRNSIPNTNLTYLNVIDVTKEYVTTSNLSYCFGETTNNDKIAYLTVYNKGKWKALWWGHLDPSGTTTFEAMGRNIVYLPARFQIKLQNGKKTKHVAYEKYPILLSKDGKTTLLKPDFDTTIDCTLSRQNEKLGKEKDFNTLTLENNKTYTLRYWEGEWKTLAKAEVQNENISFRGIPSNTLFKLEPENTDHFERIFVIDPSSCKIVWY